MSPPPAPPPVAITLDPASALGPIIVGTILTWFFMGTLVVQTFFYYMNARKDPIAIKLLVYGVVIADLLQSIFMTNETWFFTIVNWNNSEVFNEPTPWTATTIPIMAGLVSGVVQLFYAWRIWVLSTSTIMYGMSILITLVALCQSLAAITAASVYSAHPTLSNLIRLHPAFDIWLAGSFTADILICGSMIFILWKARTRSNWTRSQRIIDRLIINVVQTGTLTMICAGIDLAFFTALESTNLHLAPAIILGKLYSNSLLATLNARGTGMGTSKNASSSHSDSIGMQVQVSRLTERNPGTIGVNTAHSEWKGSKIGGKAAFSLQGDLSV